MINFKQTSMRKFFILFFFIFTPIIYLFIRLIEKKYIIRFGIFDVSRIGYFAAASELYLCNKKTQKKKNFIDIFAFEKPICNNFFLSIVKRKIKFYSFYFVKSNIQFIKLINQIFDLGKKNLLTESDISPCFDRDIYNFYDKLNKQISLTKNELNKGYELLKKIGIKKKDKIVCLIVRDNSYLKKKFPDRDFSYHDYRDCDVENFKETCHYLSNKGYVVFRMGEVANKKISFSSDRIIDYPFSKIRSNFMDIFIAYICNFSISTGTGYDALPAIFRKPTLYTNVIPVGCVMSFSKKNTYLFKKCYSKLNKSPISLSKIFDLNLQLADTSQEFKKKNIDLIENNSNEILQAIKDKLKTFNSKNKKMSLSKNQKLFWKKFINLVSYSKFINKYILTERDLSSKSLIKSTKKPSKQFIEKNKKYYGGFKGKVANSFLEKNMHFLK